VRRPSPRRSRTIGDMTLGTKSHRIALLFEYATLNGGERSMLACLDWWREHEPSLEFVAIAPSSGRLADALYEREIRVIPWTMVGPDGMKLPREAVTESLLQAVRDVRPALLHANSLAMGRITGAIADRLAIPTSAHLRDILKLSQSAIADLNRNRQLIAVSQATRDAHVAQGLDPGRLVVVRNGLDLRRFRPCQRTGWLHDELGLPINARLVATIGQIGLRKGQDTLAKAAPAIVHKVPDVHFLLIGERSSVKEESIQFERAIQQQFDESGLKGHLHCLGFRDEIPALLAEVQLVVHPANQEPFGRVLLEAAGCAVPVVATDVGGTAEIVVDQVTGLLVPPRDPEALAFAVTELLTSDDRRQSMSQAARQRAVDVFDVSHCAKQIVRHWRSLLDAESLPSSDRW